MNEITSVKNIITFLFKGYKIIGALAIPLVSLLFIVSTSNVLLTGRFAVSGVDYAWAVIYAICFETNGFRLIIDGSIARHFKQRCWVDFTIGITLIVLGVVATYIESLVQTNAVSWGLVISWFWIMSGVRSLAIIAMIVRECVHYGPTIALNIQSEQLPNNSLQTPTVNVQIANILPNSSQTPIEQIANQTEQSLQTVTELVCIPEKSLVRGDKKQTIIELIENEPNITFTQVVNKTGFSKGYVSSVMKEVRS